MSTIPPATMSPAQAPVVVSRIQNRRGTQTQFLGLYPSGYLGVGGFGSISGFDLTNYPNVLMPGELALCTDSRRIFMGNLNGEYMELASESGGLFLGPIDISLPPASSFTVIPELTYLATPFTNILYSVTDSLVTDWNVVGNNFSRNGTLQITAIAPVILNPVLLSDTSTEVNNLLPKTISFIAQYDITSTSIEILYKHNFVTSLNFNTSAIKWLPL